MFWRKKKPFRDWALAEIIDEVAHEPQIPIEQLISALLESMCSGISVGVEFQTKVIPILKQIHGNDALRHHDQMKERLVERLTVLDLMGLDVPPLSMLPPIQDFVEVAQSRGLLSVTRHQFTRLVQESYFCGLVLGSLYRGIALMALRHLIMEPNKGTVPDPLVEELLTATRKMVVSYEQEHGTLS